MKSFPNYMLIRSSKRGIWTATPFANPEPAQRRFNDDKGNRNTQAVALLEIRVNPDAEPRAMYAFIDRYSAD